MNHWLLGCSLTLIGCGGTIATPQGGADLGTTPSSDAASGNDGALATPDLANANDATTATTDAATTPLSNADTFPRLGNLAIGGTQTYDAAYQTRAAKFHVNVIGGAWEGWETQTGYSKQSVVKSVKTQSKIGSRVFQYVNLNEQPTSSSWFPTYEAKVQAMNWWVYDKGTSGTLAPSSYNSTWGVVNMTAAAPKDPSTGLGPYSWGANYVNDFFHEGKYAGTSAAPSLDGFFLDNVFTAPRENGDWARSGSTQSETDPTVDLALRTGERTFFDELTKVWPSTTTMGNMAVDKGTDFTPLTGAMDAGLDEGAIGYSWSYEFWGGSAHMQQVYKSSFDQLSGGQLLLFGHSNVQLNGSDPTTFDSSGNPTAYGPAWQGMRYGLAACLMGDGYYTPTTSDGYDSQSTQWFDEFDGGGLGVGYLGAASAPFQTAAWKSGVWKREFAHGIVLWNPKGNGSQTISLAGLGTFKRIKGTQDATVNSGASVTSVTLGDRDGIILLRD